MNRRTFLASLIAMPAAAKALVCNPPNPFVVPVFGGPKFEAQKFGGDLEWHHWKDSMVGPHGFGCMQYKIYRHVSTTSPWENLTHPA